MAFHNRPFKKDLTPFAKGGKVVKHVGKGAKEQSDGSGSLTGGDPFARMANRYPKPSDLAPSGAGLGGPPMEQAPPSQPPAAPTAMMPPPAGEPDQDDMA